MTGSLSVRGEVLPVGGVTRKVEAAVRAGIKTVIVPRTNLKDIILSNDMKNRITIKPVDQLVDVLQSALLWRGKSRLLQKIKKASKEL